MKLIASGWTQKYCWVWKRTYFLILKLNQYSISVYETRWSQFNLQVREHLQCCLQEAGRENQWKESSIYSWFPMCFFPKHLLLDSTEKRCKTRRTFGLTLFLSSYFICCMLLNNHLSKKCVWKSRAHLFYLTTGVLTEWLPPPHKLDTDSKGL